MSLFSNLEEEETELVSEDSSNPIIALTMRYLGIVGLVLVGFPALVVWGIHFWALFAKGRLRPSVITIITIFELALSFLVWKVLMWTSTITPSTYPIALYIFSCFIIGVITSYILVQVKAYQFKTNPSVLFMDGWMYKFSYRPTPWENFFRDRMRKDLVDGKYYSEKSSPIGILEAPITYQVSEVDDSKKSIEKLEITTVSRSYEAAKKQTIITGETGSGKALHRDTPIPVRGGGFSTVGELEVGDVIYDDLGAPTTILGKYQPLTPDHYLLKFKEDIEVRACGDHLWELSSGEVTPTRELFFMIERGEEVTINNSSGLSPLSDDLFTLQDIEILLNESPEDYYCFTVDSPTHLFLCTEYFIPTHNTVTMLSLIYNDIKNGYPVCLIDMKKSPDVLYFVSKWARDFGREFYYFSNGDDRDPDNPFFGDKATYDPFSSGEQSGRTDVIMSLRKWDTAADVYRARTEGLLNALFFALINVDKEDCPRIPWNEGGLAQIISALDLKNMYDLIISLSKREELTTVDKKRIETLSEMYTSLVSGSSEGKQLREQLDGIKLICNKLITSSYGTWLSKGSSTKHIDLLKIATDKRGPVVLFSLSPQEEAEFARSMGEIILSDLKRASDNKNSLGDGNLFGVYIDEFQTIPIDHVSDLLEKSRSAGFFCTLSSQSLEQISSRADGDGEAKLKGLLDTCGNFIFHSGAKDESAERMAGILGKNRHITRRSSTKSDGGLFKSNLFNRRHSVIGKVVETEWVVEPSEFMSLSRPSSSNGYRSEAMVITTVDTKDRTLSGLRGAQLTHVIAQGEITDGVPSDFKKYIANRAKVKHKRLTGEDLNLGGESFSELDEVLDIVKDPILPLGGRGVRPSNSPMSVPSGGTTDGKGTTKTSLPPLPNLRPQTTASEEGVPGDLRKDVEQPKRLTPSEGRPLTTFEKNREKQRKKH